MPPVDGYISFASARSTQAESLAVAIPALRNQIESARRNGRVAGPAPVFLGIGASLAAAGAGVWHLRERGIDATRLGAGDTPLPLPHGGGPVVGISQSGRSTETIAALGSVSPELRYAVVNNADSPIGAMVDHRFDLGGIPDSYASTVGFTATTIAISLLAEAWNDGDIDATWSALPELFAAIDERLTDGILRAASFFADAPAGDFVGAGPSVGSAEVGALLFREVARVPSSAFSTRQYLHGAMESAGAGVHVLLGNRREAAVARVLAEAGHRVILVTDDDVAESENLAVIALPTTTLTQRPVLEALVMQSLVERVAELRDVEIEEFVFHHDDTKVTAAGERA